MAIDCFLAYSDETSPLSGPQQMTPLRGRTKPQVATSPPLRHTVPPFPPDTLHQLLFIAHWLTSSTFMLQRYENQGKLSLAH